eukprot:GHVQ01036355.1.p1 GENE.GHVQ01036355.1~~GHVQ01036355.1.p1  ORF type:complete len:382 (-),score=85.56 GHVQ01036355.1:40-1185(-)
MFMCSSRQRLPSVASTLSYLSHTASVTTWTTPTIINSTSSSSFSSVSLLSCTLPSSSSSSTSATTVSASALCVYTWVMRALSFSSTSSSIYLHQRKRNKINSARRGGGGGGVGNGKSASECVKVGMMYTMNVAKDVANDDAVVADGANDDTNKKKKLYYEVIGIRQQRDGRGSRNVRIEAIDLLQHKTTFMLLTSKNKLNIFVPMCMSGHIDSIDLQTQLLTVLLLPSDYHYSSSASPSSSSSCSSLSVSKPNHYVDGDDDNYITVPMAMATGAVEYLCVGMRVDVYVHDGVSIRLGLPLCVIYKMKYKFKSWRRTNLTNHRQGNGGGREGHREGGGYQQAGNKDDDDERPRHSTMINHRQHDPHNIHHNHHNYHQHHNHR